MRGSGVSLRCGMGRPYSWGQCDNYTQNQPRPVPTVGAFRLAGGAGDTVTEPDAVKRLDHDPPPTTRGRTCRGCVVAECTHPAWSEHCPNGNSCKWFRCRVCGFTRNVKSGRAFAQPPPFDPQAVEQVPDGDEPEAV